MATTTEKPQLSPVAQKVREALYVGSGPGAIAASYNEPIPGFDSARDEAIKEYGICVGLAFAIVAIDNPFLDGDQLANLAEGPAEEAFLDMNPKYKSEGITSPSNSEAA